MAMSYGRGLRSEIDTLGRCIRHSFVQLQRQSNRTGLWVTLLDTCPLCSADDKDGDYEGYDYEDVSTTAASTVSGSQSGSSGEGGEGEETTENNDGGSGYNDSGVSVCSSALYVGGDLSSDDCDVSRLTDTSSSNPSSASIFPGPPPPPPPPFRRGVSAPPPPRSSSSSLPPPPRPPPPFGHRQQPATTVVCPPCSPGVPSTSCSLLPPLVGRAIYDSPGGISIASSLSSVSRSNRVTFASIEKTAIGVEKNPYIASTNNNNNDAILLSPRRGGASIASSEHGPRRRSTPPPPPPPPRLPLGSYGGALEPIAESPRLKRPDLDDGIRRLSSSLTLPADGIGSDMWKELTPTRSRRSSTSSLPPSASTREGRRSNALEAEDVEKEMARMKEQFYLPVPKKKHEKEEEDDEEDRNRLLTPRRSTSVQSDKGHNASLRNFEDNNDRRSRSLSSQFVRPASSSDRRAASFHASVVSDRNDASLMVDFPQHDDKGTMRWSAVDILDLHSNFNCDSKGRCVRHPHVRLHKKKLFGGWKTMMKACPDCCLEELRRMRLDRATSSSSSSTDVSSVGGGAPASAVATSATALPKETKMDEEESRRGREGIRVSGRRHGSFTKPPFLKTAARRLDSVETAVTLASTVSGSSSGEHHSSRLARHQDQGDAASPGGRSAGKDNRMLDGDIRAVERSSSEPPISSSRRCSSAGRQGAQLPNNDNNNDDNRASAEGFTNARQRPSPPNSDHTKDGSKTSKRRHNKEYKVLRDMEYVVDGRHGRYSGTVNDDGLPHGTGVMVYDDDGIRLEGVWRKGKWKRLSRGRESTTPPPPPPRHHHHQQQRQQRSESESSPTTRHHRYVLASHLEASAHTDESNPDSSKYSEESRGGSNKASGHRRRHHHTEATASRKGDVRRSKSGSKKRGSSKTRRDNGKVLESFGQEASRRSLSIGNSAEGAVTLSSPPTRRRSRSCSRERSLSRPRQQFARSA